MVSILFKFFTYKVSILCLVIFSSANLSYSQYSTNPDKHLEKSYEVISKLYGPNQVLVNGQYYDYNAMNDLGHPYYSQDDFKSAYIIIRNQKFENIRLKYDIFHQCVVVYNPQQLEQLVFSPPVNNISEFSYEQTLFRKYRFANYQDRFYQVIYDSNIKCLFFWEKKRHDSDHLGSFNAYQYSEQRRKSYLVIEETLIQFKNNSGFLSCFSEENKKEIKQYIKSNKINLKKANDSTVAALINFCESLMPTNNFAE